MNIKGTPSNRMLKNEIEKSCKLNVNQLITRQTRIQRLAAAKTMGRGRRSNGGIALNLGNRAQVLPPTALSDSWRRVLEDVSA
jgi:hypothetical protein